jgi:hypothetical protein
MEAQRRSEAKNPPRKHKEKKKIAKIDKAHNKLLYVANNALEHGR